MALALIVSAYALTDTRTSTVSLYPNGDTNTEWDSYPGLVHYLSVDEVVGNGDTDYVYTSVVNEVEEFDIESPNREDEIDSVKVFVSAKAVNMATLSTADYNIGLNINGTRYGSPSNITADSYDYRSTMYEWEQNPATGVDWQPEDIEDLQISIMSKGFSSFLTSLRVTQTFVQVDYS